MLVYVSIHVATIPKRFNTVHGRVQGMLTCLKTFLSFHASHNTCILYLTTYTHAIHVLNIRKILEKGYMTFFKILFYTGGPIPLPPLHGRNPENATSSENLLSANLRIISHLLHLFPFAILPSSIFPRFHFPCLMPKIVPNSECIATSMIIAQLSTWERRWSHTDGSACGGIDWKCGKPSVENSRVKEALQIRPQSTIQHLRTGLGMFRRKGFVKGMLLGNSKVFWYMIT